MRKRRVMKNKRRGKEENDEEKEEGTRRKRRKRRRISILMSVFNFLTFKILPFTQQWKLKKQTINYEQRLTNFKNRFYCKTKPYYGCIIIITFPTIINIIIFQKLLNNIMV